MPLPNGTRLGPYEIVAPLGAGGTGEVSRARDTRLGRDVALKVQAERLCHLANRISPDVVGRSSSVEKIEKAHCERGGENRDEPQR
jgi:serine/threonine protein kinase